MNFLLPETEINISLFFCIVLLNAHPISKSNSRNTSELEKILDNGLIIQSYPTYELLNHQYPTWKKQIFEEQDENTDKTNKLDFSNVPKKHIKFKRITTKVMDLREFERLQNFGNQKYSHNSIKTYKVKEKGSNTENNLKQTTNSYLQPLSSFLEDKHIFYNDISIEPTRDDTEFAGTAEIEAILNEIKQREIQMIADQIPSVSNLITNTVTETTYASMPLISDSSVYPGFVFSTFLLVDNQSLINFNNNIPGDHFRNYKLHNIALRSVKDDSSTLAHDVENLLQKKLKKVYHKIKNKITQDFSKEVKKTKATVKEQVDKMNKNKSSKKFTLSKATTKPIPKTQTKSKVYEARNSRNTLFNQRKHKHKLTTLTTHTIPTVGDDLSMLSIVEQLLEKSEEDNVVHMLTTKNNYSAKKDHKKLFKRNSLPQNLKQNKLLNIDEDVLNTEYTQADISINNVTKDTNFETDATTEDTSYEGLSNKLSYSDYVNGYKYYLNFQRDKDDQKYSNQVRYQAHKHHRVDDIGKFILNKIPQLPTIRLRRDFAALETLDFQDVTTKSQDSWFRKHFFMFMDSNTPKKFHTFQTVSFKPSKIQTKSICFFNQTTKQTYKNKEFPNFRYRRFKKNIDEIKEISTKTSLDEPRHYFEPEASRSKVLKKHSKRSNLLNHYKQKSDILSSINYKNNGFVDIDLINKPTAIIKLSNKNRKTNKIRNIFHKIRFGHNKPKKKEKRQIQNRFNILKGIKNIFKEKNDEEKELKSSKRHKIFDYEVITANTNVEEPYEGTKFEKLLKINELRQQIPNISADFSIPHKYFSGSYINLTDLAAVNAGQRNEKFIYNKKPELDDERKSYSILTGSQYLKTQQPVLSAYSTTSNQQNLRIDDIINVNIKTNADDIVLPKKSKTDGYPFLTGMTKTNIRNEINDMKMRLLSFDINKKNQNTFSTNVKKGYQNEYLHLFNTYPQSMSSKKYQIGKILLNDGKQNNKVNFKKPVTISAVPTANRIFLSKKSPRINKLFHLYDSNYSRDTISSLRPFINKKVQISTKINNQDIAPKKFDFQSTLLDDPTMYGLRNNLNNITMGNTKIGFKNKIKPNYFENPTLYEYEDTLNSMTTLQTNLVPSNNNNVAITNKRPLTKMNTPPEQYYSTPLPMQIDDFYKFLKNQSIDVESVTAPLFYSVPKSWNLYKKNVSKLSSKQNKMIQNKEHLKTIHNNFRVSGQSNKNHNHAYLNSKKEQSKPLLEKHKALDTSKDHIRKNIQETGETPEYENSNYLLRNKKYLRNVRKNSNLMPHLNLGSMDLFQLDNSPKQPVVNSQKEAKDMDVTVIDLEFKKPNSDVYKGQKNKKNNNMNKYPQLRAKTNFANNHIYRTTFTEPNRDPLRFTHMYNEHTLPKQWTNSPLSNYIHKKTTLLPTHPRRVQISGHSYKYDIIYQKPNYDWMSDLYEENPILFTNSIVKYKNYPTTVKENGSDELYPRGGNYTVYTHNNPLTFGPKKMRKDIYNVDHSSEDRSTLVENIILPKKEFGVTKMKSKKFFFSNKEVNNIDDEVYFEPLIRHKFHRKKSKGKVLNRNNKNYKRDVHGQDSFTAKDVAALEVVVDLMKSTESFDEKGFRNAFLDIDNQKQIPYIVPSLKSQNHTTNTIQVHIALPSNINDKKRSLEPIKVRKIFSAVMSSPVDLEYQIHSIEDNKVTGVPQDVISPGLYLLVENTNITVPKGNFALKPIRSHIGISNLIMSKNSDTILPYKINTSHSIYDRASQVTLNPDIIAAVNNQLVKLYENMVTLNETKSKRFIKKDEREENKLKIKRNINWESVKKYLGHDRVCHCRCKVNETMCKPCAASDAVITELIFEFDNLAKYMTDHCTEIQTFFWMNPTGGRKFKDTVHRIDTTLYNYYKRVKGKCQGRTCKMISSGIDKREYKINNSVNHFSKDLESLAVYLQNAVHDNIICDANLLNAGIKCVNTINECIDKNFNKRSYGSNADDLNKNGIYSLNNVRVNLICNKGLTKNAKYFTRNTITEVLFEKNTNTPSYYDEDEIKKDKKKGKGIKELLKKYSDKIKLKKKVDTPQIDVKYNKKLTMKHNKRHSVPYNQIETPFLADSGGTFWYKYLHDNMREPRQQKYILKENNTKAIRSEKCKLSNRNLITMEITEKNKIVNTLTSSKNNLPDKINETDDSSLNIDTLNHNLNDLFKLLGNTDSLQRNQTQKSKSHSSPKINTSIKTRGKLNTTIKMKTTTRPSNKTTFIKDHIKIDKSKIQQNIKQEKELTAGKNISTKNVTPKILHTTKNTISNMKTGLFNRIVSGSLKLLGNHENKEIIVTETTPSNIVHRPAMEYVKTFRQKFGVNTEKYSLKEYYNYQTDDNDNLTTLTQPTIIIIDDIGFSDKYSVSINSKNSNKSNSIEYNSLDTVKRNSFKLLKEKDCGQSPEDDMDDIGRNSVATRVKLKNITHRPTYNKNYEYCDYDIIHSIRKFLGLTSSNLTTPYERKGAVNKLFDKFSIKIIPNDKRKESNNKTVKETTISSKVVPKLNGVQNLNINRNKNITDTTIKYSTTKTTTAVANTTQSTSNQEIANVTIDNTSHTQSNSSGCNHMTKHLEEAGEDKLNKICDISSTMAYVSKLQKSMLKNIFATYVKNIPCHKYNKTPNHFIIRSCIRKPFKSYSKRHRKLKAFEEVNRQTVYKWDWIRDKRSILKDETRVEDDKGKPLKDLSGCSLPFIVNCINIDKDNANVEVNYRRHLKKHIKITEDYNIKNIYIKKNFMAPKKYNIIHNIGYKKRNLLSFSNYLLRRRGYKKNFDLNGNFFQLWYGENDYYENFVTGKDGIYRKSLKRRKRLDVDMSELNEGLQNLPPLDPFTDEIYVMVANSITFDCYSSGPPENQDEKYVWSTDRLGILDIHNVIIEGPKVSIKKIKTNNFGTYLCSVKNAIVRSIKITVIDLPNIDIVFTPVYETDTCTYDDLKSLQKLSEPISHFILNYNCFVRIDEPVCLKNSVDGSSLIRPIVVMSVKRQTIINCSAECLRDLQCSLTLLFAKNAPALALVKVLISYNGTKRILSPIRERKRSFVTYTLRKKDTNGHREYHRLAADMDPNSVNVVLLCSAGFYLVVGQKICAVCPPNTFSLEGENVCRNCPRGARSEPGARSCRLSLHLRRYKCPWKYVCGGAVCMLSCVIASCYAGSRLLRQPVSTEEIKTCRKTSKVPRMEIYHEKSKSRPLSPSRVILSRLLRCSLSSSRATDSQETRFEMWKEKNTLPPLPPIDFEL